MVNIYQPSSTKIILYHNGNDGGVTLTASIAGCTAFTRDISLGAPQPNGISRTENVCIGSTEYEYTLTALPAVPATNYLWTITVTANGSTYTNTYTSTSNYFFGYEPGISNSAVIDVKVKTQNSCGTSADQSFPYSFSPTICFSGFRIKISPNPPVSNQINIEITDDIVNNDSQVKKAEKQSLAFASIYSLENKILIKKIKFDSFQSRLNINTSDLKPGKYILQINKNGVMKSTVFIIQ